MQADGLGLPLTLPMPGAIVRAWHPGDVPSLVEHANNRNVSRHLRDRFPHPYTREHGRGFLAWVGQQEPPCVWAIAVDGRAVGGIGLQLGQDVERVSAEIGYWLGEAFWGRGLATAALEAVTARAFAMFDLARIFALPFATNAASIRVLEKAGFFREGHLRQSVIKDGVIQDQYLYARYRERNRDHEGRKVHEGHHDVLDHGKGTSLKIQDPRPKTHMSVRWVKPRLVPAWRVMAPSCSNGT